MGNEKAEEFFERYVRHNPHLTELGQLLEVLPEEPGELRDIQRYCLRAVGAGSGSLPERRRLDRLARQLGVLARRRARQR
jgi:hypothetical protein